MRLDSIKKAIEELETNEPDKNYVDKNKVETLRAVIDTLREEYSKEESLLLLPQIITITI